MEEQTARELKARVERLERLVEELRCSVLSTAPPVPAGTVADSRGPVGVSESVSRIPVSAPGRISQTGRSSPVGRSSVAPERPATSSQRASSLPWASWDPSDIAKKSQYLLSVVGIGLLLFGLAFLFKYSLDQGWISEEVRVGFGFCLGGGLLIAGLRMGRDRRSLSDLLLGGSIAAFYITAFAASQLYELLPVPVAFVIMVGTTILAFALALRRDESALAILGALGAFASPVVFVGAETASEGASQLPMLVALEAIWRVLLFMGFGGLFLVLGYAFPSLWRPEPSLRVAGVSPSVTPFSPPRQRPASFVSGTAPAGTVPSEVVGKTTGSWSDPVLAELEHNEAVGETMSPSGQDPAHWPDAFAFVKFNEATASGELRRGVSDRVFESLLTAYQSVLAMRELVQRNKGESSERTLRETLLPLLEESRHAFAEAHRRLRDELDQ